MTAETALLVVDMQLGMFVIDPPVHDAAGVLARVRELLARAREARVPVIFVQHDGPEPDHPLRPSGPGWRIHPELAPRPGETVVRKRFSDAFHETTLQQELAGRGIRQLVMAGIQTDYCVDTTCRRAFSLGYQVTLVADAHTTWDSLAYWKNSGDSLPAAQIIAHHNRVLGDGFATLCDAADIRFD